MRLHFGAIPSSPDFRPDASWKPLRQPSPWMALVVAFPIGIVAAGVVGGLWLALTPLQVHDVTSLSLWAYLLSVAGMVVVHELIHVAVHPMSGRSPDTIVGVGGPSTGIYAHYDGEMTRNRFVAILLAPLVVISFVPLLVAAAIQESWGWVAFISAFNAFGACLDILDAGLVLFGIPAAAIVRQQGLRTYWREHETPITRAKIKN